MFFDVLNDDVYPVVMHIHQLLDTHVNGNKVFTSLSIHKLSGTIDHYMQDTNSTTKPMIHFT